MRVVEFDILRAVAIIAIVVSHLPFFLPTQGYGPGFARLSSCGVALFFFISGYVLHLNHPSFPQRNSLADFYKKRVLRLFPLYWLALLIMFVITASVTLRIALVTVLGLQGFLSPRFGADLMGYFWFVGVIVVYYTIYPLITALASDTLKLPAPMDANVFKFALMLIVPLLILLAARGALFLIADNVFAFYLIFVLGVAVSKYNILGRYGLLTNNRTRLLKYVAVAAVSMTALLFVYPLLQHPSANVSTVSGFARNSGVLIVDNVLWLLFVLLVFCLVRIIVVSSSKASRPLSHAIWYRGLLVISFSTYAIYLFFGLILSQFMSALMGAQLTALEIDIIQIFIGLPTVVLIAYLLQSTQNEIVNRVRKYRTA